MGGSVMRRAWIPAAMAAAVVLGPLAAPGHAAPGAPSGAAGQSVPGPAPAGQGLGELGATGPTPGVPAPGTSRVAESLLAVIGLAVTGYLGWHLPRRAWSDGSGGGLARAEVATAAGRPGSGGGAESDR